MNTKLTRIHLGLGMGEIGVQFEVDDGAGGTVTQRTFLVVDDAALAPVWLAAQSALAAKIGALPLDMPPGNVTTALMQQRTAEAAASRARDEEQASKAAASQAEAKRKDLEGEHARLDEELAKKVEQATKLDAELAAKRADAAQAP